MKKEIRAKNRGPRQYSPWSFVLSLSALLFSFTLDAAPVSADSARKAAEHWLRRKSAAHMKAHFGARKATGVRTFRAEDVDAFHVVALEGGGFVIVSADDRVEPVVAFADSGTLDENPENPLWALLKCDIPQRLREHRRGTARRRDPLTMRGRGRSRRWRSAIDEWKGLLADEESSIEANARQSFVSDVRVEPLVKSKWNQSTAASGKCYNYYTPNGYVCGCVATAGAQLMRYYSYPTASIEPRTMSCWVDKEVVDKTMMGGVYDWAAMPLEPSKGLTEAQRQAIGKLCYDVGVASRMDWKSGASGACPAVLAKSFVDVFGYASTKCELYNPMPTDKTEDAIYANLDARRPVLLGISGEGGHEIVADGYGVYEGTIYTHLNLGWGGSNDAWYALPEVTTTSYAFDAITSIVYNVFPTETGELLTGRVTKENGEPIAGVRIEATNGSTVRGATTDEYGIYAVLVAGERTWSISASIAGRTSEPIRVAVGSSKSSTLNSLSQGSYNYTKNGTVGNRWGNDIVLPDYEAPALLSVAIDGPPKVMAGKTATYVCIGRFKDGEVHPITSASWKLSDNTTKSKKEWWDIFGLNVKTTTYATMDEAGVLTAKKSGKTVMLTVTGTENGISRSTTIGVEIVDNDPTQIVPTLADLRADFGSESEIARKIVDETELRAFNEFLVHCGIWSIEGLFEGQKRWAYRSFALSKLAVSPELYETEPKLKIVEPILTDDGMVSFAVSLTAGEREIALSRQAVSACIRVGSELDKINALPDIVIEPITDGERLNFVIRRPYGATGFIRISL